jgi:BirA family biotin operon repressor/biotin-[acetyl-CoA-carboxylase] ligase
MLARPTPEEMRAHGTWLPLAAAVAVGETLARAWPGLGVRIKWPNDLWIGDAKLGGILCEGVAGRGGAFVVIGLGLNCAGAPEGLDLGTISLSAARGEPIVADQVRDPVVHALRAMLDQLRAGGARGLADRYASLAALPPGSAIRWQPGGEPRTGTVLGLGPFGELRVRAPGGAEESLFAEDVSRIRAAN